MPKKSEITSPSFGYDSWSRRRTIDEAKNIARWFPGLLMSGWQNLFKERLLKNLKF